MLMIHVLEGLTHMPLNEDDLPYMKASLMANGQMPPPAYDDGASQFGQDPYMQQVGLFGRGPKPVKPVVPPIDIQRRSILGLSPQAEYSVPAIRPADIPVPTSNFPVPAPQQAPAPTPAPAPSVSPLNDLAAKVMNTPVSRREVLKKAGQAALNQALPTTKIADVVPEIVPPLAEVAKTAFAKNGNIDFHLGDFIHHVFSDAYEQEPQAAAQGAWLLARDYLKDRIPKEKLDSMDALANTPNGEPDKYSSDDISNKDAHELYIHMQHQLTHNLKPHEMVDVLWELTPRHDNDEHDLYDIMSKFYQYDPRSYQPKFAELGLKPKQGDRSFEFQSLVTPEEFSNYLDQSWEQAQKEKKATKNKTEKKSK